MEDEEEEEDGGVMFTRCKKQAIESRDIIQGIFDSFLSYFTSYPTSFLPSVMIVG